MSTPPSTSFRAASLNHSSTSGLSAPVHVPLCSLRYLLTLDWLTPRSWEICSCVNRYSWYRMFTSRLLILGIKRLLTASQGALMSPLLPVMTESSISTFPGCQTSFKKSLFKIPRGDQLQQKISFYVQWQYQLTVGVFQNFREQRINTSNVWLLMVKASEPESDSILR